MKAVFNVGGKYTIFKISEAMAFTTKTQLIVDEIRHDEGERIKLEVIFHEPKGRKRYILPLVSRHYESAPDKVFSGAIFNGFDLLHTCDSDSKREPDKTSGLFLVRSMRGNSCFNFIGKSEHVRQWIENSNLNPYFDKSAVVAIYGPDENDEAVVYPELNKGRHAVISRIMERQEVAQISA